MALSAHVDTLIVGGGITGLAAAHRLATEGHTTWLLVEREPRLGGKIQTDTVGHYVVERGPDCFLASKPAAVDLCRALGIEHRLMGTAPAFRRTYVRKGDRLHELPAGITGLVPTRVAPLFTSPLLSRVGRVRAALEVLVPRRDDGEEESVARFVARRFGAEAYDWLIEPLVSGIFAGDGRALSLQATFPQLADLERQYGSVLRGVLRARRQAQDTDPVEASTGLGFLTLEGGMAELVEAIEQRLPPDRVRCGVAVRALRPVSDGFVASLDDGTEVSATAVILALPAHAAADAVGAFAGALAERLEAIPFVSTATVSVALPRSVVPSPLDGYGFVSPRACGGPLVACTWTSNKFPRRAPDDGVLIRFFLGRAGNDGIVQAPDDEIRGFVRAELRALDIGAEPAHWRIARWPKGIPQYTLGHERRVAAIEREAARHGALILAGASYAGVGIPDCITSGRGAAERALAVMKAAAP